MKSKIKIFCIVLFAFIVPVLAAGSVIYFKTQDIKWDDEKVKTENLIVSIQKLIMSIESPLSKIKNYLDIANPLKDAPVIKDAIDDPLVTAYEEHYETSLMLIEKLKKNEEAAKELLVAIENKDKETFRSLKKQILADISKAEEWQSKYKETSDAIKVLQNNAQ